MISELTEDELFQILMTSDFVDNLRPEEYKYLLFKFRNFYKILLAKLERYQEQKEMTIKHLNSQVENLSQEKFNTEVRLANLENETLEFKKPRKLTLSERIKGEFVYNTNKLP
jgi:hypothetical protein